MLDSRKNLAAMLVEKNFDAINSSNPINFFITGIAERSVQFGRFKSCLNINYHKKSFQCKRMQNRSGFEAKRIAEVDRKYIITYTYR